MSPSLKKIFPFLNWLPLVNRGTLRADFLAGLTGSVMVLPQGVAFAMIAGLPPEYGLYTAMIIPIVSALFGSSYHMISGPATAISLVIFASLGKHEEPGTEAFIQLAFTLTLMVGLIQLFLGLVRMGTLVNFVSHNVIIGFTAGAALLIATSQVNHVLGIELTGSKDFLHVWLKIFEQLRESNAYVMLVGLSTLAMAVGIKYFLPKWPHLLIAMFGGSLLTYLIDGSAHGVLLIGELPAHLPPFSLPNMDSEVLRNLAPDAFAIALLGLIEAVSIGRAIGARSGQRLNSNQEFIGQGLSNAVASFFSSFAGSGSFTRSGVNYEAGAKTPMAAIFAAILLMLALLFVAPFAAYLPIPAMGGLILLVAYKLIDFHHIREILKTSKSETAILTVTFFSTLFLDLEFAIYLGVILSLVFYLQRSSNPRIVSLAPRPSDPERKFSNVERYGLEECPQLKVLRIDGSLYFGALETLSDLMGELRKGGEGHLLILGGGINFIDMAGADWLVQEIDRWREAGKQVYLSGLKLKTREFLKRGEYWQHIGDDHIYSSKREAITAIYQILDREICEQCEVRVFSECRSGLPPTLGPDPRPIREEQAE